jgi:hypothetical protein
MTKFLRVLAVPLGLGLMATPVILYLREMEIGRSPMAVVVGILILAYGIGGMKLLEKMGWSGSKSKKAKTD